MLSIEHAWIDKMDITDKQFFVELGGHIAHLRKEHGLTQQQLAGQIGLAQQTLAHYETARLRVPASLLPQLAQILGVPVDTLIGQGSRAKAKRGLVPRLAQHLERINQLPKAQQRFVLQMLETALAQASR